MKIRFGLLVLALVAGLCATDAQRPRKKIVVKSSRMVESYMDSLSHARSHIDSVSLSSDDSRLSMLFTPLTFYRSPANHLLRLNPNREVGDSLDNMLDRTLMDVYLNRPDLVRDTQSHLEAVGAPVVVDKRSKKNMVDVIEPEAPKAIEPEAGPMDILVLKPNFWSFMGDYYVQFLQNYISSNWYKGGESNYSMLGSATMQANYNNKQKVKWDNKLEMRLGYQTSREDSIHGLKASEDLLRYTSKLGLQASKKWYYTLQMIAQTQFTHGLKSNDEKVYSDFFSPFTLNLSVGMDYTADWLNHKLKGSVHLAPFALSWTYVGRGDLATRYGLDEGRHGETDFGSECTVDLAWQIMDNLKWKTRLFAYTTYERAQLEWENQLSFQFNRYISTNVFLYPRFDDGVSRDEGDSYWQFKEYMSIGFSYSF